MARSFQRLDVTAPSSANTSFDTMWSQQAQAESAMTSFLTDGGNGAPTNLQARKTSTTLKALGGQEVITTLSKAERGTFELDKLREHDRILSQDSNRESTSTYSSIDEDSLWNATHKVESKINPTTKVSASVPSSTTKPTELKQGFAAHNASPSINQEESPTKMLRESHNIRDIPTHNLFSNDLLDLPDNNHKIPYFVRFMCHYLSTTQAVNQDILLQILQSPASHASSESFWAAIGKHNDSDKRHSSKMGSRLWQAAKRNFEGYTFKGQISFSPKQSGPVFCFKPAPIEAENSCRFQRKFGADRFLYLTAPIFESKSSKRFNAIEMEQVRKRWYEWLSNVHTFLGRQWQVFHIEPVKNKKTKKRQHEATHDKRIVLFATSGCDIATVSIGTLLNWFIHFANNASQSFCKIFERIGLGLSRTIPTLVFLPSQVEKVGDMRSNGEAECTEFNDSKFKWQIVPEAQVMNDGCSLMSVGAAQQIWKRYRGAMGIREAQALPSAFQGRIGGAKGMWTVSGESFSKDPKDLEVWIQISETQLKFQPHKHDLLGESFDPLRLTFEVTNYSKAPCAHELHMAYIPILIDRGVPCDTIATMMTTQLNADRDELLDALADPPRLYDWLHRNGATISSSDISWHTGLPVALEQKIKLMLEAGFTPAKSPYLAGAIEKFVQTKQVLKETKLRTALGKSTYLFGIADPHGVLKPGEVHVQFSSRFTDKVTEESFMRLNNMNILVSRQPACRHSDIQKVKTTVHAALSHLFDVIVFPSRGQYPLAGKLQGGDYDGDLFWLCWDSNLVEPFLNAPAPVQGLNPLSYGIKVDKRRLSEVMSPDDMDSVNGLLREAFTFRSNPSMLGLVTTLLERMAYRVNKVYSPELDQICDLHDLLVDATKQGYSFTQTDLNVFQRERLGLYKPLEKQAHTAAMNDCLSTIKVDAVEKLRQTDYHHKSNRVLDYLYFEVLRTHNIETSRRVKRVFSSVENPDDTLLFPYRNLQGKQPPVIDKELGNLIDRLAKLSSRWNTGFHKGLSMEESNAHAEECYRTFQTMQPSQADDPEIKAWLEPYCGPDTCSWKFIKASVLYAKHHAYGVDFVFKMAGQELTELKAKSFARTRLVIASIHANMKPKRIKAPAELDDEDDFDSDEEFEAALEQIAI
jgi:hypothetical protein